MKLRLLILSFFVTLLAFTARAHPVAQGTMEMVVHKDHVEVRARVSVEQAFVAEGLGEGHTAANLDEVWQRHGQYLAEHLQVQVDGQPLTGRVAKVTPPLNTAPTMRIGYELRYDLPPGAKPAREVVFRQNLLNEITYAPGNQWEATFVVTIGQTNRVAQTGILFTHQQPLVYTADWNAPTQVASDPQIDRGRMFGEYLHHGALHIVTGYDHLLFMAALVLAVSTLWDLVKVVTAFTVAHTVTLTLSVLDLVRLPSHIVEPMIAASIVVVALQNLFWPRQSRGWARLAVAFGFGLFHGLGFAGGLLEAMEDLPHMAIATAIIAFSIGVELGHQVVVLPVYFALKVLRRTAAPPRPQAVLRYASALVCFAGMYYFVAALR